MPALLKTCNMKPAALCRAQRRSQRCMAEAQRAPVAVKVPLRTTGRRSLLGLLSENVASEAQLSVFEALAGRSAMLGCTTAIVVELATQQALFPSVSASDQAVAVACIAGCIAAAALLGGTSQQTFGEGLRDSVLSSMTAVKRSAASLTATANLDEALDVILSRTFDRNWTTRVTTAVSDLLDDDLW